MNKIKKMFYTVATGVVIGMALGVLFAPEKGAETRDKLRRLKNKLGWSGNEIDDNKNALEELSDILEKELAMVNEKIAKLS